MIYWIGIALAIRWSMSQSTTCSVLIAEDDPDQRENLSETLIECGFKVEAVADGDTALSRLIDGAHDLAILDIRMPGKNGLQVMRQLRLHEGGKKHLPVFLVSAFITDSDGSILVDSGADAAFSKPFRVSELLQAVGSAIRRI